MLIQTGKYIGFLPSYYARQWCDQGLLKPLLEDDVYVESEVSAIVHQQQQAEIFTRGLLDSLMNLIE